MFRPNKNIQLGGGYTDTTSLLNSDVYDKLSPANRQFLHSAIDTPTILTKLTSAYNSTISSIGSTISSLEAEFTRQTQLNISSTTNKHAAYLAYLATVDPLTKYSSAYIYSSMLCSSYVSTLNYVSSYVSTSTAMLIEISTCTSLSTCQTVQSGGQAEQTQMLSYDDLVAISTLHGSTINSEISSITNIRIPAILTALSTYSTQYISAANAYSSAQLYIDQMISTNGFIASTNSTLNASIAVLTDRIRLTQADYLAAKGIIAADDAVITYLSTLKIDTDTYAIYNSTITTMQVIENIYNLVMNGLSVPTELISSIKIQEGGGIYTNTYQPMYSISSFTCDPSDAVCNAKLSKLNNYINAYLTLSTVLPTYSQSYDTAHQARINAEANTTFRLSTILQDALKTFDDQIIAAQNDIQVYKNLLQKEQTTLSRLYTLSTSPTVSLPTNSLTTVRI